VVLVGGVCLLLAGMAVNWLVAAVTHRLALRLDRDGVTLGRVPFPPTHLVTVPWRDIRSIVLFERQSSLQGYTDHVPHIGLRLTPDAVRPRGIPTPGTVRARLYRLNAGLRPWPVDVYRVIRGWHLDQDRLAKAVRGFGRHVTIIQED